MRGSSASKPRCCIWAVADAGNRVENRCRSAQQPYSAVRAVRSCDLTAQSPSNRPRMPLRKPCAPSAGTGLRTGSINGRAREMPCRRASKPHGREPLAFAGCRRRLWYVSGGDRWHNARFLRSTQENGIAHSVMQSSTTHPVLTTALSLQPGLQAYSETVFGCSMIRSSSLLQPRWMVSSRASCCRRQRAMRDDLLRPTGSIWTFQGA